MSRNVIEMSLVLVFRRRGGQAEVLLGEKLRGFGHGRIVAPGGKVDAGETPVQAASRELREETGVRIPVSRLSYRALLDFTFAAGSTASMRAHVFTAELFEAGSTAAERATQTPSDSDEIAVRWAPLGEIPYDRMWDDAGLWLPKVLGGETPHLVFHYGSDGTSVESYEEVGPLPAVASARRDGPDRTE